MRIQKTPVVSAVLMSGILVGGAVYASSSANSQWLSAGYDSHNTRYQSTERRISPTTVGGLGVKWSFTTGGDVSATPAVDGTTVYAPDWAGNLYAVDRNSGVERWHVKIADATGLPGDKARNTPAVSGDQVIVGTQGVGLGASVLAYNKNTGALKWKTTVDSFFASIITQSATVFGDTVYVGVASQEEALAAFIPGYQCCGFRGSMLALDANTGAIKWKTYIVPAGYSGGAVWGSSPAIDTKRGQLYIATGNNYSVPQSVLDCVTAHPSDPACVAADDHFDSIMALDLKTGAVRWSTQALPFDAWTVDCIPFLGDGHNCPQPAGPDYDFGQAPALFTVTAKGKPVELVGAGQKSGQYWALQPDSGAVVWVTQAGPGGTAGGLQWGSAVDGTRVYTANANSNSVPYPGPAGLTSGVWSALDAATGAIQWQTRPPAGGSTSGPVTTANGVVFGCSLDPMGHMYALNAATGAVLWSFASGGSCLSGAAISNGEVFWGSGYSNFGFGTPNNKLYAFTLR